MAGPPFATGNSLRSVAVDPNDRWVYVANLGGDDVSGFSLDSASGALSPLTGSPYAAGAGGVNSVTVAPNGQYVFLAGYGGLFVYSIGQLEPFQGGVLTPVSGSPFGGGNPNVLAA